jgi:hypothetical protein
MKVIVRSLANQNAGRSDALIPTGASRFPWPDSFGHIVNVGFQRLALCTATNGRHYEEPNE